MNTKTNDTAKINTIRASGGHADFGDSTPTLADVAPAGMAPSTGSQVTGITVIDLVEDLSSPGQIAVLRAIANGAICGAVFAQHQALTDDDEDRAEAAGFRAAQNAELYSFISDKIGPLVMTQYDRPMTLEQAIDFASSQARDNRVNEELPEEFLEMLGLSREAVKLIDATEQQKQKARSEKLRESIRLNAEAITADVASFIGTDSDNVVNELTAEQHVALYDKSSKALSKALTRLIAVRSRYDGALGEALLVSADIKIVDKAFRDFRKKNDSELRDAA